jgi:hypothetical protein
MELAQMSQRTGGGRKQRERGENALPGEESPKKKKVRNKNKTKADDAAPGLSADAQRTSYDHAAKAKAARDVIAKAKAKASAGSGGRGRSADRADGDKVAVVDPEGRCYFYNSELRGGKKCTHGTTCKRTHERIPEDLWKTLTPPMRSKTPPPKGKGKGKGKGKSQSPSARSSSPSGGKDKGPCRAHIKSPGSCPRCPGCPFPHLEGAALAAARKAAGYT